jgi:hypothetical protein
MNEIGVWRMVPLTMRRRNPYAGTLANIDANLMVGINISYEINYSVAA